jgi:parallel beta-helix repeat protein
MPVQKSLLIAFLTALLIGGLALVSTVNSGTVKASTEVSGIINLDTTWTKANSPYELTRHMAVEEGVTLEIEPGVVLNLNEFYIQVNGTLIARGSSTDPIRLNGAGGGPIEFTESSTGWNSQAGTGSIIEYAIIDTRLRLGGGSPMINKNTITRSISVGGGSPIISKNSIDIVTGSDWLGRPSYPSVAISISNENTALIVDNDIFGDFYVAAVSIGNGSPTIQRNIISNSYGYGGDPGHTVAGITISGDSNPVIKQNTITKNANGISIYDSPTPTIVNNNIEDNTNYNLRISSNTQVNIDAANNWWGTTDTAEIDKKIWDYNDSDDFNTGKVNYTPFLTETNSQAMPDPNAPTPTLAPTSSPTASPSTSPTPSQEPQQTDQAEAIVGVAITAIVLGAGLGLLIYLIKRK